MVSCLASELWGSDCRATVQGAPPQLRAWQPYCLLAFESCFLSPCPEATATAKTQGLAGGQVVLPARAWRAMVVIEGDTSEPRGSWAQGMESGVAASLASSALNSGWAPGWGFAAEGESLSTCRCEALPCPGLGPLLLGGGVMKSEHPSFKNIYQAFEDLSNCSPRCQRTESIIPFIIIVEAPLLFVLTLRTVDCPAWVAMTSLTCHRPPSRSQPLPDSPSSGQCW